MERTTVEHLWPLRPVVLHNGASGHRNNAATDHESRPGIHPTGPFSAVVEGSYVPAGYNGVVSLRLSLER